MIVGLPSMSHKGWAYGGGRRSPELCRTYTRVAKCAYAQARKCPVLQPGDKQTFTPWVLVVVETPPDQ